MSLRVEHLAQNLFKTGNFLFVLGCNDDWLRKYTGRNGANHQAPPGVWPSAEGHEVFAQEPLWYTVGALPT